MKKSRKSPCALPDVAGDLTALLTPYEGEAVPLPADFKLSDLLDPPSVPTPPVREIATARDFTSAMLDAVRELNQNEDLRREVAKCRRLQS